MLCAVTVWIIGWCFSVGLCLDNTRGLGGAMLSIIYLFFWPLLLGCWVRTFLKEGEF